jgi:putative Mg2+ transporter-C (MgtC) family protein
VILREGLNIRGMNTAGTLWCSAAVGALAGSGFSAVAGITTAVVVMTNTALRSLGPRIERHQASGTEVEVSYQLIVTCREQDEQHLRTLLLQGVTRDGLILRSLRSNNIAGASNIRVEAELMTDGRQDRRIEQVASRLSIEPGVTSISWQAISSALAE